MLCKVIVTICGREWVARPPFTTLSQLYLLYMFRHLLTQWRQSYMEVCIRKKEPTNDSDVLLPQ